MKEGGISVVILVGLEESHVGNSWTHSEGKC